MARSVNVPPAVPMTPLVAGVRNVPVPSGFEAHYEALRAFEGPIARRGPGAWAGGALDMLAARFEWLEVELPESREESYNVTVSAIHELIAVLWRLRNSGIDSLAERFPRPLEQIKLVHKNSPIVRRMQEWPRRYPGDFETIEILCDCRNTASPGTFAWYIEQYVLHCAIAQQHRNKLLASAEAISRTLTATDGRAAILNVACGGMREIEYVRNAVLGDAHFTICDIDSDALACAGQRLEAIDLSYSAIEGNFVTRMRDIKEEAPFDLAIAGGILDYLTDRQATFLLRNLYAMLSVGGLLFFTNIAETNPFRPWIEEVGNWRLTHRSETDVQRIVEDSGINAATNIVRDQTGLSLLASICKT